MNTLLFSDLSMAPPKKYFYHCFLESSITINAFSFIRDRPVYLQNKVPYSDEKLVQVYIYKFQKHNLETL